MHRWITPAPLGTESIARGLRGSREPAERVVRERISRGTVSVFVRLERVGGDQGSQLNLSAIESYWRQIRSVCERLHVSAPDDLSSLLLLPGVVTDDGRRTADLDADWPIVRGLLEQALEKLQVFRQEEGRSMQQDLQLNGNLISRQVDQVVALAPQVVQEYRTRLLERVRQALSDSEAQVTPADLIREVSIYAERSDINEEITRLKCHLDQFQAFLQEPVSAGRKLEFLTQEMFREVNTIGSKANNVPIAHSVVEMKAAVEKIREVLQNVE